MRLAALALALLASALLAAPAAADTKLTRGYITMDDGVTLAYQVMHARSRDVRPGPYPTVLDYSGYGPGRTVNYDLDTHFVDRGYALAGVNIRGTGCSGGKFDYFEERQSVDGKQAIEWLTAQPWSNGRLAMVNKSYPGITQLFVGAQRPRGPRRDRARARLRRPLPRRPLSGRHPQRDLRRRLEPRRAAGSARPRRSPQGIAAGDRTCAANQAEHARERRATTRSSRPSSTSTTTTCSAPARRTSSPTASRCRRCWSGRGRTSRSARAAIEPGRALRPRTPTGGCWPPTATTASTDTAEVDASRWSRAFVDHYLRGDDNGVRRTTRG